MATIISSGGGGKAAAVEYGKFVFPATATTETVTTNLNALYFGVAIPNAGTVLASFYGTFYNNGLIAFPGSTMNGTSTGNDYGIDTSSGTLTLNRGGTATAALTYSYKLEGAN